MPTVTVRPGATDEYVIPFTHGWERQQEIGRMRRLLIDVDRAEARNANLTPKDDQITLTGVDTVRLIDVQTGGETWTLVCYSAEWDANRAGFTDGGNLREGNDQTLITNLVGEVSSWTAGTINSYSGPLSFVFNHAARHEAIRRIEKNVSGEIQFRDFGTVDYVDRLGSDRSGSVELSAAAGTIEERIDITERGRELDGTHIRVLGAHEGEAQYFANLVPSTDSDTYPNRVDYTTSRWSDGDPKDWDRWANKDVTGQATIEEEAAALGAELDESLVEATAVVPSSVGLTIGDTVQVVKSDADLNRSMRVHRLTRQAGTRAPVDGDAAVVDKVLLSTRTILRTEDDRDLKDIQRFNSGFQGSSVVIQGGGSRQPVDATHNAEIPFDYPPLEYENEAAVHVRALPYRSYVSGAGHSHDVTVTHPNHNHSISTTSANNSEYSQQDSSLTDYTVTNVNSSSWTTASTFSPTGDTQEVFLFARVANTSETDRSQISIYGRLYNSSDGVYYPTSTGERLVLLASGTGGMWFVAPENANSDNLELQLQSKLTDDYDLNVASNYIAVSSHSHGVSDTSTTALGTNETSTSNSVAGFDPGINDFSTETASNVDVLINGNTVATNIGSGTFETTVDISGALTQDSWNTIELTSDTLGHIQAVISVDGYKQIGTK